jgi:hypothetical protein
MNCQCGTQLEETEWICGDCFEHWRVGLRDLKPSTARNVRGETLIPEAIYRAMPDYLVKDLDDAVSWMRLE